MAARKCDSFLLNAFVGRVNLRLIMRSVRFWRPMYEVEM